VDERVKREVKGGKNARELVEREIFWEVGKERRREREAVLLSMVVSAGFQFWP
jgi:hypothetical protein